jgi:hypothetical protein
MARWSLVPDSVDSYSSSFVTIDFEHHEVHEGNAYVGFFSNTVTNIDEQSVIAFRTPATGPLINLLVSASATAIATLTLNENTSIDEDEGTQVAGVNRNRGSSNTSLIRSIQSTETVGSYTTFNEAQAASANITETTVLYSEQFGSSGAPQSRSGVSRAFGEFLLAQNQEYAIILNADDNNDNLHRLIVTWYEHTDSDLDAERV